MQKLLDMLVRARELGYAVPLPDSELSAEDEFTRLVAAEFDRLMQQYRTATGTHRRWRARLMADADVLTDTLSRIGLGQFETARALDVMDDLALLRMGIEDMARMLEQSKAELDATIEELRRSEAEVRRKGEAAEAATRAKSAFLANMSHEIRTPLNAILGLSHLALGTDLNGRQRGYLRKIEGSGRVLLALVNDVLDFSKIEAGRLELESEPFHPRDVVESISDMFSASVSGKPIEFVTFVAPEVPSTVVGDPMRLGQVLINLVSNAVKFTEKGEIVVRISAQEVTPDHVRLGFSVKDTGIGIEPAAAGQLFKAFTQADGSTTRKYGGTGLGLAISKSLVELMGGAIGLQSAPGTGSTFSFSAVFGQVSETDDSAMPDYSAALYGKRALIVEDHDVSRQMLVEYLLGFGIQCGTAETAEEALDKLADGLETPVDLVLMDWRLPGMDGIEATVRMRRDARLRAVPVLLVTAHGTEDVWRRAMEAGVAAFLVKPIKQSSLFNTLVDALSGAPRREKEASAELVKNSTSARRLAGSKVLLVEDNSINQQVATELLQRVGVTVEVACNGVEALNRLVESEYEAVLMDVQMPLLDGLSATRALRAGRWAPAGDAQPIVIPPARQRVPVIAMTAHSIKGDREKCLAAGMDDYVKKPIDVAELYRTLARYLPDRSPSGSAVSPPEHRPSMAAKASEPRQPLSPQQLPDAPELPRLPEQLPGLDVQRGLARVGGDTRLYLKLLAQFDRDQGSSAERMQNEIAAQDWEGATRTAHTLKGLAATLGMELLSKAAAEVEEGMRQRREAALQSLLAHLSRELYPALASLRTLVESRGSASQAGTTRAHTGGAAGQQPVPPPALAAGLPVPSGFSALVDRLAGEIGRNSFGSASALSAVVHSWPPAGEALGPVEDALNRMDFPTARDAFARVLPQLRSLADGGAA
jgi:signal transduction histidine kinase/CheY-like chemotaxis protein/HPt (histidine-containing phosphotransfer) domain-containing protein